MCTPCSATFIRPRQRDSLPTASPKTAPTITNIATKTATATRSVLILLKGVASFSMQPAWLLFHYPIINCDNYF